MWEAIDRHNPVTAAKNFGSAVTGAIGSAVWKLTPQAAKKEFGLLGSAAQIGLGAGTNPLATRIAAAKAEDGAAQEVKRQQDLARQIAKDTPVSEKP